MTKEEMKNMVKREEFSLIFTTLAICQGIFIITLLISPIIWVWHSWDLASKIGATGLIGILVFYFLHKIVDRTVQKVVYDEYDNIQQVESEMIPGKKSKFQERLSQMQRKNNEVDMLPLTALGTVDFSRIKYGFEYDIDHWIERNIGFRTHLKDLLIGKGDHQNIEVKLIQHGRENSVIFHKKVPA